MRHGKKDIILDMNLRNDCIEIFYGAFLDNSHSGFVIGNGALLSIANGRERGSYSGCTYNRIPGGFALSTSPEIEIPNGFAFPFKPCPIEKYQ